MAGVWNKQQKALGKAVLISGSREEALLFETMWKELEVSTGNMKSMGHNDADSTWLQMRNKAKVNGAQQGRGD